MRTGWAGLVLAAGMALGGASSGHAYTAPSGSFEYGFGGQISTFYIAGNLEFGQSPKSFANLSLMVHDGEGCTNDIAYNCYTYYNINDAHALVEIDPLLIIPYYGPDFFTRHVSITSSDYNVIGSYVITDKFDINKVYSSEQFSQIGYSIQLNFVAATLTGIPDNFDIISTFNGLPVSQGQYYDLIPSPVPLPKALPLFGSAMLVLGGLGYGMKRRSRLRAA